MTNEKKPNNEADTQHLDLDGGSDGPALRNMKHPPSPAECLRRVQEREDVLRSQLEHDWLMEFDSHQVFEGLISIDKSLVKDPVEMLVTGLRKFLPRTLDEVRGFLNRRGWTDHEAVINSETFYIEDGYLKVVPKAPTTSNEPARPSSVLYNRLWEAGGWLPGEGDAPGAEELVLYGFAESYPEGLAIRSLQSNMDAMWSSIKDPVDALQNTGLIDIATAHWCSEIDLDKGYVVISSEVFDESKHSSNRADLDWRRCIRCMFDGRVDINQAVRRAMIDSVVHHDHSRLGLVEVDTLIQLAAFGKVLFPKYPVTHPGQP